MPLTNKYLEAAFGPSYAGLATVGYTLKDAAGVVVVARSTTGVFEQAGGTYGVVAPVIADNVATVEWDTGGASPVYAHESIRPEELNPPPTSDGMIWVDGADGNDSDDGRANSPVATLDRVAALIAGGDERRIVRIVGSYLSFLTANDDFEGIEFIGDNHAKTAISRNSRKFDGCTFRDMFVSGVESGAQTIPNSYYNCRLTGTMGTMFAWSCMFVGDCTFIKGGPAYKFTDCSSHGAIGESVATRFGWTGTGDGTGSMTVSGWDGDLALFDLDDTVGGINTNLTGVWIHMNSGRLRIETTVIGGTPSTPIVVTGSGTLEKNRWRFDGYGVSPFVLDRRASTNIHANGEVWLTTGTWSVGTYPGDGTAAYPIYAQYDAFNIADERFGFYGTPQYWRLVILSPTGGGFGGWLYCRDQVSRKHIVGLGWDRSAIVMDTAFPGSFTYCLVEDCYLLAPTGDVTLQNSYLRRCKLSTLTPGDVEDNGLIDVTFDDCGFVNGETYMVRGPALFQNCFAEIVRDTFGGPPNFRFGSVVSDHDRAVFKNWKGDISIQADTAGNADVYVDCNGGTVTITADSLGVGVTITVTGDCEINDLRDPLLSSSTLVDARQDERLNTAHGDGIWEPLAVGPELAALFLKAQTSPFRKHVDSVANVMADMREIEAGGQEVDDTDSGTLHIRDDQNVDTGLAFETYDKNGNRTDNLSRITRRDRIADTLTGDVISWSAGQAVSDDVVNLDAELDLIFEGRLSNGEIPILKPFGTADTDADGAEYWVAPTAASGFVAFRLLHTGTQAAQPGLSMRVLGAAPLPALIEYGPYTFDSQGDADSDALLYTDPVETNATLPQGPNTARRWCWDEDDTTSTGVGPTSGAGGSPDGYLHIESSSPTALADEFYLELENPLSLGAPYSFPASLYNILVEFKTNVRGDDADSTIELQTNEGAGWVTQLSIGPGDPNKVASGGVDIWAPRSVDLTGVVTAACRIRIRVVMAGATIFHNDIGFDEIKFTLTKI